MISRIRVSRRYLSDFNYEGRTETKNSRKASFLFHPGAQHCHLQLGPCSPPWHTPGPGLLCSPQPARDSLRDGSPGSLPPKNHTALLPWSPSSALLWLPWPHRLLPSHPAGPSHKPTAQRGSAERWAERPGHGHGRDLVGQKLREEEVSPRASKPNRSVADTGCIYTAKDSCDAVSPTSFTRPLPAPLAPRLLRNFAQLQTPWEDLVGESSPCPAWGAGGSLSHTTG